MSCCVTYPVTSHTNLERKLLLDWSPNHEDIATFTPSTRPLSNSAEENSKQLIWKEDIETKDSKIKAKKQLEDIYANLRMILVGYASLIEALQPSRAASRFMYLGLYKPLAAAFSFVEAALCGMRIHGVRVDVGCDLEVARHL